MTLSASFIQDLGLKLQTRYGNFINGQTVMPTSGNFLPVIDPATATIVAHAPDSNTQDVDQAVLAAQQAFENPSWSQMRPADREKMLFTLSTLIEDHADELSALETLQSGKLRQIARLVDVQSGAELVRYMAGWATKLEGQTFSPSIRTPDGAQYHTWTRREPVGVVAAIVPWNFPLAIALWKVAPALAAGCTVVLKPSPETPLTALRLAELVMQAGFPPGVLNIVCGAGDTGAALVSHPGIQKISLTGSTATGQAIARVAATNLTRTTLELGGKSPLIVLEDADIDRAAQGAAMGIFFNQGQVCTAGSRVYVHERIYEAVVDKLARAAEQLKIGSGFDADTQLGPVNSERHFNRVMSHLDSARADGATILTGGTRHGEAGYFIKPTVLVDVHENMRVVQEEIFGPVVTAMPFKHIEEVIQKANDSPYGLAASIWSNDLAQVHRLIPRLQAGTVWVNCHNMLDSNLPLGGFKRSGVGKDLGRAAVESYTEIKSICMAF